MIERRLGVRGYRGDEIFRPGSRGLDVLRADFEDFLEVDADVGELALEEDDNLICFSSWLYSSPP